jgi:hypothetical protein
MKEKRRVVARSYFNANILYHLQIFERNCFKQWITVNSTTDEAAAEKWKSESTSFFRKDLAR